MESIGQMLKAARERRQMAVSDVVAATKMTSAYVKAIEANDFDALVAPVYARGFIKLYAECVGLDPLPLLKKLGADGRAAPMSLKAPPMQAPVAPAGKQKPPRQQQSGLLPLRGASVKPAPISNPPLSWAASLLAGRLSALNRTFIARVRWPRFNLPGRPACNAVRGATGRLFQCLSLPAMVWRRIFVVAGVILLIIAASLAWEWSSRGMPTMTVACRWLAEPPAPYLTVEAHTPTPGR